MGGRGSVRGGRLLLSVRCYMLADMQHFDFMRRRLLAVVGLVSFAFALLQLVLAFLSADASRHFGAPRWVLAILEKGGPKLWLLAFLAVGVSVMVGLYTLSGAGLVRRLPAVRAVLFLLGGLSTLWGLKVLALVALEMQHPGSVMPRFFVIRGAPLLLGLIFLLGASEASACQSRQAVGQAEPGGPADGGKPFRSETKQQSGTAGSRR